ncbi:MAG: hypothetical protein COW48_00005, partial [Hydrogenophilales bacterium CG17_big_fil_post_rev_8_21_14_2_50_63_12]
MSLSAALAALIWSHFHPHKSLYPEHLAKQWHIWLLENFKALFANAVVKHGHPWPKPATVGVSGRQPIYG